MSASLRRAALVLFVSTACKPGPSGSAGETDTDDTDEPASSDAPTTGGPPADCLLDLVGAPKCIKFSSGPLCYGALPPWHPSGRPLVRDFTGDGLDDLVIGSEPGKLHLARSSCEGLVELPPLEVEWSWPPHLLDFDGDGLLDLAVQAPDLTAAFLRGDGTGLFTPTASGALPGTLVAAGDLDGDGMDDLVTRLDSDLAVLHNDGVDNFTLARQLMLGQGSASSAVIADVDLDGVQDVLVAVTHKGDHLPTGSCHAVAYFGDVVTGSYLAAVEGDDVYPTCPIDIGAQPILRDLNDDGLPDLVLVNRVFLGASPGGFHPDPFTLLPVHALGAVDLDGNSFPDLVGPNSLLRNRGDITFEGKGYQPSFTPGDINGDGLTDLIASEAGQLIVAVAVPP